MQSLSKEVLYCDDEMFFYVLAHVEGWELLKLDCYRLWWIHLQQVVVVVVVPVGPSWSRCTRGWGKESFGL